MSLSAATLASILVLAAPGGSTALAAPPTSASHLAAGTVGSVTVTVAPNNAVNVTGMTYSVGFTTSPAGALGPSDAITITAATGTVFVNSVSVRDVTTGQSFAEDASISGSTAVVPTGGFTQIAAGDKVLVTLSNVTNAPSLGTNTLTVSTSTDPGPASGTYALVAQHSIPAAATVTVTPNNAVNVTGMTYQVGFTTSSTGALGQFSTITVKAAPGTVFFNSVTVQDVTTGQRFAEDASISGDTAVVPSGGFTQIAPGDKVLVTLANVTSAPSIGTNSVTVSTSSDTGQATGTYTLVAQHAIPAGVQVAVTPSASVNGSAITYSVGFTTSSTGALGQFSTITVKAAPGTVFFNSVTVQDVTTGQSFAEDASISGDTAVVPSGGFTQIAPGDKVLVTLANVTSGPDTGTNSVTVSTSSDTGQAAGTYTLTRAAAALAPGVTVSTQAPGQPASYTIMLTASATGALDAGGSIVAAAPPGTVFSDAGGYTIDDITSGQTGGIDPSISDGGATVTLRSPVAVAAGDQVSLTITGVTNPTASGHVTMRLSTTSDTVATSTNSYIIGDSPPIFTQASPPGAATAGTSMQYTFATTGFPAASYSLTGAPSWLRIQSVTGQLSGKIPAGTKSFSYSVKATNNSGTAVEGPFDVTVGQGAKVSGVVTDSSGGPIADALVDACDPSGGVCETTKTGNSGGFSVAALAKSTIALTAYPPPGSGAATNSTSPLEVPAKGLTGVTIILPAGIPPIPGGLLVNGSSSPVVYWASPSTASQTACQDGFGYVTLVGQNTQTGDYTASLLPMSEAPAGSGFYTAVIPPQEPVHGPEDIQSSISCPASGAVVPDAGPGAGGNTIYLSGQGFSGATAVSFGAKKAASFTVSSDHVIEAVAPSGSGTVPVTITEKGDKPVSIGRYTYSAVTSVSPATGPASGKTKVVITGTGLGSATAVFFGTKAATFTQVSDSKIDAVSPPGHGTVDVSVDTLNGGLTSVTAADRFRYGSAGEARGLGIAEGRPQVPSYDPGSFRAIQAAVEAARGQSRAGGPGAPQVLFPPCSHSLNLSTVVLECLANILPSPLVNELAALKADIDAVWNPSCATTIDAASQTVQAALEGVIAAIINRTVGTVTLLVLAAVLPYAAAFGLLGIVAAGIIAGLVFLYATYRIQTAIGDFVTAEIQKLFAGLHCPPHTPGAMAFAPNTYIDPSGTVLDTNGHPIKGATVTILHSYTKNGAYLPVSKTSPGILPATNPETTASDGVFHWEVYAGWYKVQATAPGCVNPARRLAKTVTIGPYPVPPPQTGLTITMSCRHEAKPSAPKITSISAVSGSPGGGTKLTILGSGFTPGSKVLFGSKPAPKVTYLSNVALTLTTPAGHGLVSVRVRTKSGTSAKSASGTFFYGIAPTVTKLSTRSGPPAGGTVVTITGQGFTGATVVSFGAIPARKFTVRSSTQLRVTAPAATAGTVDVRVTNPAGTSATGKADRFSYRKGAGTRISP